MPRAHATPIKLEYEEDVKVKMETGTNAPSINGANPFEQFKLKTEPTVATIPSALRRSTRASIKTAVKSEPKVEDEEQIAERSGVKRERDEEVEEIESALESASDDGKFDARAVWRSAWAAIVEMRSSRDAPVDSQGCECVGPAPDAKTERFRVLVSLMLSAQTKDQTTHATVQRLNVYWHAKGGLSLDNIRSATESELDGLIAKVSFHRRKANFIKRTAELLHSAFDDDLPRDVDGLCSLPGVGPKMAVLAMNCGWKIVAGIGTDVHVHRVSNRLGWVHTKETEDTRAELESFIPKSMWLELNKAFVGFGQQICLPTVPKCGECKAAPYCAVGRVNVARLARGMKIKAVSKSEARAAVKSKSKRKRVIYTKIDDIPLSSNTRIDTYLQEADMAGVSVAAEQQAVESELLAKAPQLEHDNDNDKENSDNLDAAISAACAVSALVTDKPE